MTAASMDCASSYSERASSPTVGSEKILGNLKAIRRVQQKLVSLVAETPFLGQRKGKSYEEVSLSRNLRIKL